MQHLFRPSQTVPLLLQTEAQDMVLECFPLLTFVVRIWSYSIIWLF